MKSKGCLFFLIIVHNVASLKMVHWSIVVLLAFLSLVQMELYKSIKRLMRFKKKGLKKS